MLVRLFLSYSRSDDEVFVRWLYDGLKTAGFEVWFDRVSMPSRELTFSKEIEDAISSCDRLVFVVGPSAVSSDYVSHEWRFAFHQAVKCVNPILRLGDYDIIPEDLRGPHIEDFRDDSAVDFHLSNLVRQLSDPLPPLGKLVAVPALPPHYLEQGDRIRSLRDLLLADLQKPVVVSGASGRVGLHGMGGIGKSLLANALARRPEVRREFPDGVFWVTLGQQPLIVELQRSIAKELGDEHLFTTAIEGRERLRELFKDRASLLILDDAWQREDADAFNVIGPRCRLLLTTRDAGLVTALAAKENHYQVQLPTEAEARAMLAGAAGIPVEKLPQETREIVTECERLPLALGLCGGMVHGGTAWRDLLEALREHDLGFLSDAHPSEEQHANVWKTIDVSIRVLPEDQRRRFGELAVFALDAGAPEAAVETLWEHTAGLASRYARKLLRDFAARSLVQFDAGRAAMHDLIHDFASGMVTDPASLHCTLLDAYRKKCSDGWVSGPNDGYFLEHLIGHLVAGNRGDDASSLLTGLDWIETKCAAGLALSLDEDYRLAGATQPEAIAPALMEFAEFARSQSHILTRYPRLTFQQAANWPDGTAPCLLATQRWAEGSITAPWFRCLNKGLSRDACLVTLPNMTLLARSYDGTHLLLRLHGDGLCLFDVASSKEVSRVGVNAEGVNTCALSPDGTHLATGYDDGRLSLWELNGSQSDMTLVGQMGSVKTCAFSPSGNMIAAAGTDAVIRIWSSKTGELLHRLTGHTAEIAALVFSPSTECLTSASWDKTLRIWDLNTGRVLAVLGGHTSLVVACEYSRDGHYIVSGSIDTTVKLWDATTAVELATLRGHTDGVHSCSISADGRYIVSGQSGEFSAGEVKLWDSTSLTELSTVVHGADVVACSFALGGRRVVTSGHHTKIWDLSRLIHTPKELAHELWIGSCTFSPNGRYLVSQSMDEDVKIWDATAQRLMYSKRLSGMGYGHLEFSPQTDRIIFGGGPLLSDAGRVEVWRADTGDAEFSFPGGNTVGGSRFAVTPDGARIISAGPSNVCTIWDANGARELGSFDHHSASVRSVCCSPFGRLCMSSDRSGAVFIWDVPSLRLVAALPASGADRTTCRFLPDGRCALTTDESWPVKGSGDSGIITLWRINDRHHVTRLNSFSVAHTSNFSVSPNGRTIALQGRRPNCIDVWDLTSGIQCTSLTGHEELIADFAFLPDGERIITGSHDNTVRIWDIQSGDQLAQFVGAAPIGVIAFTRNGNLIVEAEANLLRFLELLGCDTTLPLVTAVRLWKFKTRAGTFVPAVGEQEGWEDFFTFQCVRCAARSPISNVTQDALLVLHRELGFALGQATVFEFPAEAWRDPRLISECAFCGIRFRLNPFVAAFTKFDEIT